MLTYSFGVIEWTQTDLDNVNRAIGVMFTKYTQTDLDNVNRAIGVMFTKYRAYHPKSSIERFHLPRKKGGRSVLDIHYEQIEALRKYFHLKEETSPLHRAIHYEQIEALRKYFHLKEETSPLHRAIIKMDKGITPLNLRKKE
ncbi:hypothetical protein QE152_g146 [Popillia japonica]|uniref:Uncharacterized protein n=1 Tax=Popillia japonica TaxID=7064 RepID=A0AAW1NMV9_POPJA